MYGKAYIPEPGEVAPSHLDLLRHRVRCSLPHKGGTTSNQK
jgi:hypothetical protein